MILGYIGETHKFEDTRTNDSYRFVLQSKKISDNWDTTQSDYVYFSTYKDLMDGVFAVAPSRDKVNRVNDLSIMNEQDLRDIMSLITFKNSVLDFNWSFDLKEINKGTWFVWANFERPDTHTGKMGVGRGRDEVVQIGFSESRTYFTLNLCIEMLIRHEFMEGSRYMGVRPVFPHNSVHALNSLSVNIP